MARRSEDFAHLGSHGGYTQALTVGKGFSGSGRDTAKRGAAMGHGLGQGGRGTETAYARHLALIRNYHRYNLSAKVPDSGAIEAKGLPGQQRLTDNEALRRQHRFVRDHEQDKQAQEARGLEGIDADPTSWEVRMAAKYYKLLFKEYALADLSRYREDKVGLRWRTEKDVVSGKGQFECGALRCQERKDLHSYELNFKYKEAGAVKNELVKVRVCPQCARKLFRKKIEALRRQRAAEQEKNERERRRRAKAGIGQEDEAAQNVSEKHDRGFLSRGGVSVGVGRGVAAGSSNTGETGAGGSPGSITLGEGHDLVRQAVAAAGGGDTDAGSTKRRRRSRWGDAPSGPAGAGTSRVDVVSGGGGVLGVGVEGAAGAGGSSTIVKSDDAARKAWAGELERDRTAEDEMDDYLSSLLL